MKTKILIFLAVFVPNLTWAQSYVQIPIEAKANNVKIINLKENGLLLCQKTENQQKNSYLLDTAHCRANLVVEENILLNRLLFSKIFLIRGKFRHTGWSMEVLGGVYTPPMPGPA